MESTAPSAARKYGSAYYRSLFASSLSKSIYAAYALQLLATIATYSPVCFAF